VTSILDPLLTIFDPLWGVRGGGLTPQSGGYGGVLWAPYDPGGWAPYDPGGPMGPVRPGGSYGPHTTRGVLWAPYEGGPPRAPKQAVGQGDPWDPSEPAPADLGPPLGPWRAVGGDQRTEGSATDAHQRGTLVSCAPRRGAQPAREGGPVRARGGPSRSPEPTPVDTRVCVGRAPTRRARGPRLPAPGRPGPLPGGCGPLVAPCAHRSTLPCSSLFPHRGVPPHGPCPWGVTIKRANAQATSKNITMTCCPFLEVARVRALGVPVAGLGPCGGRRASNIVYAKMRRGFRTPFDKSAFSTPLLWGP